MDPVIALVIRLLGTWAGGGAQSKGKALPDTACPPPLTEVAERHTHKACVERDANAPAPWYGERSQVRIGFEALTSVIYLM